MPIYEYSCLHCGLKFEHLLRSNDEDFACPRCRHKELKKLPSTFAFSSKDSSGNVTSSSSGCSGCAATNCATCSR